MSPLVAIFAVILQLASAYPPCIDQLNNYGQDFYKSFEQLPQLQQSQQQLFSCLPQAAEWPQAPQLNEAFPCLAHARSLGGNQLQIPSYQLSNQLPMIRTQRSLPSPTLSCALPCLNNAKFSVALPQY